MRIAACLLPALLALPALASPRWWLEARQTREAHSPARIPDRIREILDRAGSGKPSRVAGEEIRISADLDSFYLRRACKPAWIAWGRHATPAAFQLRDAVHKSRLDGLDPGEYHAAALDSLLPLFGRRFGWGPGPTARTAASLDLLLTDAYLRLASDLLRGRVHPLSRRDVWHVSPEKTDLAAHLEGALDRRGRIRESLQRIAPAGREYGVMKWWLAEYRALEEGGGWPVLPADAAREGGGKTLCTRLASERHLDARACGNPGDSLLAQGLRRFQAHQGLPPTGRLDATTLARLNVPVRERIRQILLNLECWRWLPRELGTRHVRVNIADFRLEAWEDGKVASAMKVVVGTKEDSTPVLSDRISSIILNPPWHVPDSIAARELLPSIREDGDYLEKQGMELVTSWKAGAPSVDPDTVDWESVDPEHFPFRIRQKAGEGSALGKVKFALGNPFQIYLHDTPAKSYFERHKRAFSHGCVRVEKPVELASWVLGSDWPVERLGKEIAAGETRSLDVPGEGVPVHILYWTAFADPEGGLQFRPDVYKWNRRMAEDLKERTAGL